MNVVRSKHTLGHCNGCDTDMVLCATCGNNCCNAGHGTLPGGAPCPDCEEAYSHQSMLWEHPEWIEFAKDVRPGMMMRGQSKPLRPREG